MVMRQVILRGINNINVRYRYIPFGLLYVAMVFSYGVNSFFAALATTSFLFLFATNPYWAPFAKGVANLAQHKVLYLSVMLITAIYAVFQLTSIVKSTTTTIIVLWGSGKVEVSSSYIYLYAISHALFSIAFATIFLLRNRDQKGLSD